MYYDVSCNKQQNSKQCSECDDPFLQQRLKKFEFWSDEDDKDMIFLEAERGGDNNDRDKSELHLKFKFPTFEEFSRVHKGRGDSFASSNAFEFASSTRPVSAFIEVLTTFPPREITRGDRNGDTVEFSPARKPVKVVDEAEEEEEKIINKFDAHEFGENEVEKVDECEFFSESSSSSNNNSNDDFLSDGDFGGRENKEEVKRVGGEDEESDFLGPTNFGVNLEERSGEDCGDANRSSLEALWEHQELIEQLQMELRKVRASGLPTILEESESPKMADDLKPWKIEETEKVQHQDCMGELHKQYKSYLEMMRKFDILNYQKMYAMGFLQLQDPFQPKTNKKSNPPPMLKSLVSQNLWLMKHKKHGSSPMKKLMKELEGDVEVVYVGQMCLSWEFLHWQYERALELWTSDPHGLHRYNEVAGELQQFQVLVQRFTEDEAFQGPRVQSYVRNRCVLRNLLQVPVIREDSLEGQKKKEMDEYAITSEMLVEMVEECIRIFWQFVRSDKDCNTIVSYNKLPHTNTHEDLKLLIELHKILQKKERKLKDVLRSERCILRKLRKRREEDDSEQALQFFAQVDLKLVCRVFNMSRVTRDQLIWCQNKLSRISFLNRKIYVQPAFLLFPC